MAHGLPPNSWKNVTGALRRTKKGKQFLTRLAEGCHSGCDYDEAEGALVCHCASCQLTIVQLAYEMFVEEDTDGTAVAQSRRILGVKL
jgi:hypothetical protein